eukprot:TRINITY_DN15064_c0_g1_i1.p1 TRINITY_DN15064_c0_g1~~TRINITY_DN15064_c0_g1_i1.p1  ORF type:complete len:354 (+),score=45.23 TRINITY_DN15064_c0_g1_i1:30-1091(+)
MRICADETVHRHTIDKLRKMREYKGADLNQADIVAARLDLGLSFLGLGDDSSKDRPVIVEVLDRLVSTLDTDCSEADINTLTELSVSIFPPLILDVLTFWVDYTMSPSTMKHDLDNIFQSSFLEGDQWSCGVGPLLLAVLPFDITVYLKDAWVRRNCKRLAIAYEIESSTSIIPWHGSRPCVLTAFYCRAHKVQKLFTNLNVRKKVVDNQIVEDKATLLIRKTIHKGDHPKLFTIEEGTSPNENCGVTGIIDIEKCIIAYLTPRDLRSAELTCRAWCNHISSTPLYRSQLHLGAFLRNRFVSFFKDSWGDENLNMLLLSRTRNYFIEKYTVFVENLEKSKKVKKQEPKTSMFL